MTHSPGIFTYSTASYLELAKYYSVFLVIPSFVVDYSRCGSDSPMTPIQSVIAVIKCTNL